MKNRVISYLGIPASLAGAQLTVGNKPQIWENQVPNLAAKIHESFITS
jgi:hypothetical protein